MSQITVFLCQSQKNQKLKYVESDRIYIFLQFRDIYSAKNITGLDKFYTTGQLPRSELPFFLTTGSPSRFRLPFPPRSLQFGPNHKYPLIIITIFRYSLSPLIIFGSDHPIVSFFSQYSGYTHQHSSLNIGPFIIFFRHNHSAPLILAPLRIFFGYNILPLYNYSS